ncbi:dynamin-like GTPase mgm1 [Pichia californica]|uniref:dynamin GTPase n=1 Tax=Pichia californica TaxID=460514 RepID=A0A9P6WQG9_9ASCO|nr:dynamin-like GTPase mgm1 [[Candida] californica]KAG0691392.1 dynamin-like GTPase mgm1 [[Candida] californica]
MIVRATVDSTLNRYAKTSIRCLSTSSSNRFGIGGYRAKLFFFNNKRHISTIQSIRPFSFFTIGKAAAKVAKVPVYLGGSLAAAGSYVMYKVEEAQNYTSEQLDKAKELAGTAKDGINGFLGGILSQINDLNEGNNTGTEGNNNNKNNNNNDDDETLVGSATTAASIGLLSSNNDDFTLNDEALEEDEDIDEEEENKQREILEDQMLNLTRQMIEIRNILLNVNGATDLRLPSIVVIGSQSSGKSSVLESIVGQEFLPKGSNMVTRRPIELTLVNDPSSASEVAEFPALKMFNMTDFQQVQKVLVDLNLAVPQDEAVSADPIQLTIKSPRVPDLSLVDLPGYIQVEAADQPTTLKSKIREVCDKYLEEPNIILAISAADVDLANSSALRSARRADPRGERTIGIITKLDLVDADTARSMLLNKKYPLRMGYVGVVTKIPKSTSIFQRKSGIQAFIAQQNAERKFFKDNKELFAGTNVGTKLLKKKLIRVLERSMSGALKPMQHQVQNELEETSYKFKVEFNDRDLTCEKYMAQTIDTLKMEIKEFSEKFGRPELKSLLRSELDQKVLDLLALRYWNKSEPFLKKNPGISDYELEEPSISELNSVKSDETFWHRKLDLATANLTKIGVGRLSTTLVTDAILTEIDVLINATELRNNDMIKHAIKEAAVSVLNQRYNSTSDQVENCIKPFKYEIEVEDREWGLSRKHSLSLLNEEMKEAKEAYDVIKKTVGGNKLKQIMTYIINENNSVGQNIERENLGFSPGLLLRGREAIFLNDRLTILNMRIKSLQSSTCKHKENKFKCPEIFLDVVAEKLTQTAILFLNVELLSDFYYSFPRELEKRLGSNLTTDEIENFAKQDPKVKRHIELQERKELLELALSKIDDVMAIQKRL